jgi:hypothetical protein
LKLSSLRDSKVENILLTTFVSSACTSTIVTKRLACVPTTGYSQCCKDEVYFF